MLWDLHAVPSRSFYEQRVAWILNLLINSSKINVDAGN